MDNCLSDRLFLPVFLSVLFQLSISHYPFDVFIVFCRRGVAFS